jgi:hypothetical protein
MTTQEIKNLIIDQIEKWDKLNLCAAQFTILHWVYLRLSLSHLSICSIIRFLIS